MTRPLRIEFPGAFYHVTSRGNERKAIFKSLRDRELPALRDIRNRPGLDDLEQVVNSVLQSDEKLARQVKLYLCHRYSGKKLREIGNRFGVSESGVTQASRRIRIKQKNDKKLGKLIRKIVRDLSLSNV